GTSGNDYIYGEANDDILYGGGGNDTIRGGSGDDIIQGNDGNDTIYGDAGQDDIVGGTGRTISNSNIAPSVADGRLDGNDTIYGGDGAGGVTSDDFDVIAGDNADIQRVLTGGLWTTNTFNSGKARIITLYDIGMVGSPAGAGTSGNDNIFGEANDDVLYGGGGNDLISGDNVRNDAGAITVDEKANGGDDIIQGNAGNDRLYGDAGQDDLVGGTGRTISSDSTSAQDGRLDGDDEIYGGDGAFGITGDDWDLLAGDNADVQRALDGAGRWKLSDRKTGKGNATTGKDSNRGSNAVQRIVKLLDEGTLAAPPSAGTSGNDRLFGEADADTMYGQGRNDLMRGGFGDDVMFGGAGDDDMFGEHGDDVMYGQNGGDNMDGGGGEDISEGGGSDETNECMASAHITPPDSGSTRADRDEGAQGGKGGSKNNPPLKRRNSVCTSVVAVVVTAASGPLALGQTRQFTATGISSDGTTANLTDSVIWMSTNTTVATVTSPGGLAQGAAAGDTVIKAVYFEIISNEVTVTVAVAL
ncbi:MAG: Ig-like domain-containing protein, partial [Chloroflexi bacterium]|nr:Ig-like domain-containing protein [Chloroflexota bacterium]